MDISENSGTPKSSILIGLSIINHPFWGTTIFGNTHIDNTFSVWGTSCTVVSYQVVPAVEPKDDKTAPTPKVAATPKPRGRPRKDAEARASGNGQQKWWEAKMLFIPLSPWPALFEFINIYIVYRCNRVTHEKWNI